MSTTAAVVVPSSRAYVVPSSLTRSSLVSARRACTRRVCPLRRSPCSVVVASSAAAGGGGIPPEDVELDRPLGMILQPLAFGGGVFVKELVPGGNAEKSGKVQVHESSMSHATLSLAHRRRFQLSPA